MSPVRYTKIGLIDNFLGKSILRLAIEKLLTLRKNYFQRLAGIIKFGILGLFIGPIIAAMSITIFEIYQIQFGSSIQ